MNKTTVGFALCGSFCTFSKVIPIITELKNKGYHILPIMSHVAYTTDTRFGKAEDFIKTIETGKVSTYIDCQVTETIVEIVENIIEALKS